MRLTELEPHFVGRCVPGSGSFERLPDSWGAQGILFYCPRCLTREAVPIGHLLLIWFENAEGVAPAPADARPVARWKRTGNTFETLTLVPSINAGCWHGHVVSGAVTDA